MHAVSRDRVTLPPIARAASALRIRSRCEQLPRRDDPCRTFGIVNDVKVKNLIAQLRLTQAFDRLVNRPILPPQKEIGPYVSQMRYQRRAERRFFLF